MDDSDEEMSYDSEYDDDNESDAFEAPPITHHESMFAILDEPECLRLANKAASEMAELLCCDLDTAATLLRRHKWDKDKLTDAFMSDPEKVSHAAGVSMSGDDRSILHEGGKVIIGGVAQPASTVLPPITCTICYEMTSDYSAQACGHPFCNACYAEFLSHKIEDEGHECFFARCPEPKCGLLVPAAHFHALVPEPEKLARYKKAASLARSFVDDQPGLKWCPAADCCNAVRGKPSVLSIKCACKHRFCYHCMDDDHQPASCEELKRWTIKCKDDSETYNWLIANTKACPKCQTSIEKNGGCNHMTCKNTSCKYEFCWVCCGPWKEHSGSYYNCNKYDPEKDKSTDGQKKKDSSKAALERYLHYYTRYTNHQNSLRFEIEAKAKMEVKIKEMEKIGDNTWMDCQYISEANDALHECRYALKFTYVYAFYLPKEDNFREHFEMQQAALEQQTDELAELLEKDVSEIKRMDVVHCYQMALKRLRNLIEIHVAERNRKQESGGGGSSSSDSFAGSSSSHPMLVG